MELASDILERKKLESKEGVNDIYASEWMNVTKRCSVFMSS
jgi:hypothetical protein